MHDPFESEIQYEEEAMSELDSFVQYGNRQSQDIRQTAAFVKTSNTSNRPTRIDQVKQIEASERKHNKQP